jgi:large subunit ribosomal protein L21
MYAIVNVRGTQTRMAPDEVIEVPHLAGAPGQTLTFDQVLLLADGDRITVGQPYLTGAKATAEVLDQFRGPKLKIFKYKRRNDYRKRRGHRTELTRLRVTGIQA